MDVGLVKFLPPKDPFLTKYIKGYYVHTSPEIDFHGKVTFYQNITSTISIYKDSVVSGAGRYRTQTYQENAGFLSILAGKVDRYQEVTFIGPLDRLAIVFYPTGINHFIDKPLGELLEENFVTFTHFDRYFQTFLPKVYAEDSLETKRDILDVFFLEKFKPFPDERVLHTVGRLIESPTKARVQEIAEELGISRRTLLRLFQKHLFYTPEEYMSVIKFRRALLYYQEQKDAPNLTQIALDSGYYDQPAFSKQLKHRSGLSPKELFGQLEIMDDVLFWNLS
ncbi:MAG: helix-turn-helix domain-containing protein [Bacteroidota bacterium]